MAIEFDRGALARELAKLNSQLTQVTEQAARLQPVPVGCSPRECIWSEDQARLYYYPGAPAHKHRTPLLVVYSLVNRPYILDFKPERSMLGALRDAGFDVYLLDWGYPDPADRFLTLEDYICGYLQRSVELVRRRHDVDRVNLLGVCQGGTLSLCYAALNPSRVRNLVTLVTPVDFHAGDSVLRHLSKHVDIDHVVDTSGNISSDLLNGVFVSLKPYRLLSQRYVDMLQLAADADGLADFLRMEQWMYDSPDQAGEAFRQFAKDFYQHNKLLAGDIFLGERRVELRRLAMPVLNIYASADHLVPPASALALGSAVSSKDYTAQEFAGGHLGVFISGRAQKGLFPTMASWLGARDA